MSALTGPRRNPDVSLKQIKRTLKNAEVAHEGGLACIDTSDGSLVPCQAGTTLKAIGLFIDVGETGVTGDGVKKVRVRLFKEVLAWWFVNDTGTPVDDSDFAGPCYGLDDQTVTGASAGKSKVGRVWGIDSAKGVLVEPIISAAGL